ncbi:MAG: DNA polymerase III subunit alpha [Desulfovibrio sp.]|jgi:DNA polymerase-3 subunit alpha|nr:DNA polymerase III subunit alpha [Desulfovibrio sp.]
MPDFVHLHCHSEYSLLDGAIRLHDLCARAKEFGMPAAAVTDHGNLYGALKFWLTAKDFGIKPIIGCEVYTCPDHRDKSPERGSLRFHLLLLAQNSTGYHNLVRLVSHGHLYGFYRRPRVDKHLLREMSEGIIALSACMAGEVPRTFLKNGMDAALEQAREYAAVYPGRFYLELQSNGLDVQEKINTALLEIGEKLALPVVATNDCHYLNADDADAHDVLLCIQTGKKITDTERMRFETRELYYKSPEQTAADFAGLPYALDNALRIAEQCGDYAFTFNRYHFPVYELSEDVSPEEEFRRLSRAGLERRLERRQTAAPGNVDVQMYRDRLEHELDVICSMGFAGYFLIVQDFINWAKDNGIPVGPGRGSAAGSLVAYALRITNLDPIPYNLLFERFLNSERVSMPDIDVDFCEAKRQAVIDYMHRKYGADSVSQITTFGKMLARAAVRDVGRALGMTYQETDRIAKLIPTDLKMTIRKALEQESELRVLYESDPATRKLLDTSMRLEGLSRHASIHAAGLVVSDRPMVEYLPVYRGKGENDIVTQFDMKMVEKVGLVKFDFLGLRNMTVIAETLDNIRARGKEVPDLDALPLDDPAAYALYSRGDTDGVFQVESAGMRRYLKQLKPTSFEDIIAMLALYRPGPLGSGMVTEFIQRKHGKVDVSYPLPELEECLKDTYGVIVYQEQVMQIARLAGNYSLGGADLLRRAMGKKDPAAMAAERSRFINGAAQRGVPAAKAEEIFSLMEKFAEYGFNKSHSAAYALISYHTAWLKTHYPVEFMAALLSSEMGSQDKLLKYTAACRDMGVEILPADIAHSRWEFTVRDDKVLFGLGAVKNTGREAVQELIAVREKDGPFTSLLDLCRRVSSRRLTKRALESLIKAGACDGFGVARAAMLAALDTAVAKGQREHKGKKAGRLSLLSMAPQSEAASTGLGWNGPENAVPEWDSEQFSRFEKEALGFYFTSHPLQPYRKEMERLRLTPLEDCRELEPEDVFACAVLAKVDKLRSDAKGRRWALLQVEDLTASATAFCFSTIYEKYRDLLIPDLPLYMEGRISRRRDDDKAPENDEGAQAEIVFIIEKIASLAEACLESGEPYCIVMDEARATGGRLSALSELLSRHRGPVPVHLLLDLGDAWCRLKLPDAYGIKPGPLFDRDVGLWETGDI